MSLFDKLVQSIKSIPPNVKGTPIDRNQYLTELGDEPMFVSADKDDYKVVIVELWKLIEDIERTVDVTSGDNDALKSIVKHLTEKRFVYFEENDIQIFERKKNNQHD